MQVAREVGKHFEAGDYHKLPIKVRPSFDCLMVVASVRTSQQLTPAPLKTQVFPMGDVREALEFMKTVNIIK